MIKSINFQYDYVNEHEKSMVKNRYFMNETPLYSNIKEVDASTNPVSLFITS